MRAVRFALLAGAVSGAAVCAQSADARTYTITPFAGSGSPGFSGDGSNAEGAQVNNAWGLAFDSSGNLYVADQINHRIRRITPSGTISTIAGNGTASFGGDGNAATNASMNYPSGLAVAPNGNVYIADTVNHRIRMVATGGNISTVAGMGEAGSTGDGAPAMEAKLNYPTAVVVDAAGRVLIADTYNHKIRAITSDGNISTIAGTGTAGVSGDGGAATAAKLNYPQGLALDAAGRIYIADTFNQRIRRIDTDGTITTVAGNGEPGFGGDGDLAAKAQLFYPKGIAVDSEGNLIIADCFNSRVRMVSPEGIIRTIAGNGLFGDRGDWGPALRARLRFPAGVAVDSSGRVYVADTQNNKIRLLIPDLPIGDGGDIPTESTGDTSTGSEN